MKNVDIIVLDDDKMCAIFLTIKLKEKVVDGIFVKTFKNNKGQIVDIPQGTHAKIKEK